MNRHLMPDGPRPCSQCRVERTVEEYLRKDKIWRTCNECSFKAAALRKAETAHATAATEAMDMHIAQRIARLNINKQQQFATMLHQQDFELYHQQQVEQQWLAEQWDPRITLNHILFDQEAYEPAPLELHEQRRRLTHQTQQLYDPENLFSQIENTNQGIDGGTNQGMLLDCGVSNPNFHCHLDASANAEQSNVGCNYSRFGSDSDIDYPFEFHWTPEVQEIDLDQCLVNALAAGFPALHGPGLSYNEDMPQLTPLRDLGTLELPIDYPPEYYSFGGAERVDSMLLDDPNNSYMPSNTEIPHMMEVNMLSTDPWLVPSEAFNTVAGVAQAQPEVPAKPARKPRKKSAAVNLDAYFADFDPSQDILRQPTSPKRDLTGEPLAKQLISEIGLAIRLSELHQRWRKLAMDKWFKEVATIDRLEVHQLITPWGPLSNWFTFYQIEVEPLGERYGDGSNLDWQMRLKLRAEQKLIMKSLKEQLGKTALELFQDNTKALFEVLVELTGEKDSHLMTKALNKHIRDMKAKVARDCLGDKVLYLQVHKQ